MIRELKLMGYIDITLPVQTGMVHHPSVPPFEYTQIRDMKKGDRSNLRRLCLGSHFGTHFDAPYHMIADGKKGDEMPADIFIGRAKVFSFMSGEDIDEGCVEKLDIEKGDIVLFKTPNSPLMLEEKFTEDYVSVTPGAARMLVDKGARAAGIDYVSIDKYGKYESHLILLNAGVPILEGLYLANVEPGSYKMTALFMSIKDSDGAPVRAILETGS
jgi:arylformamidase